MMRKTLFIACAFALAGMPAAFGIKTEFHGDLNNRFLFYGNQQGFMNLNGSDPRLDEGEDNFASIKYRLWTIVGTDDDAVKGVYAIELGAVRFGREGGGKSQGGGFSGDGVNIETRWAYTDFALADARVKIGLQPFKVNNYIWNETATGVRWEGKQDQYDYVIGWARGREYFNRGPDADFVDDNDNILGRVDLSPAEGTKTGLFVLYQRAKPGEASPGEVTSERWRVKQFGDVDYNIISLGIDGGWKGDDGVYANWDFMYQNGSVDNVAFVDNASNPGGTGDEGTPSAVGDFDLSAWFAGVEVGGNIEATKVYGKFWYASGDDNPNDTDFKAFLSTDVDIFDSIALQEGGYVDDNYYTESPYILDRGMIMIKGGADHKLSDQVKVGGALLYMLTAEDVTYTDDGGGAQASNDLGFEIQGYVSYQIYKNLELAWNAGLLLSGDAMDYFDVAGKRDGSADQDIFRTTARARYKF
jgi:hypothetical protein